MANDLNNVVLIGRLTKDANIAYNNNGTAIATVSLANNRSVKRGDNWEKEVSYFDVSIFGKTAENLKPYLLKGKLIAVEGALRQDRWEKDGQKFSKVKVNAETVQLLGGSENTGTRTNAAPTTYSTPAYTPLAPAVPQYAPPPVQDTSLFDDEGFPEDIPF